MDKTIGDAKPIPTTEINTVKDTFAIDLVVTQFCTREELIYRRAVILRELSAINAILKVDTIDSLSEKAVDEQV